MTPTKEQGFIQILFVAIIVIGAVMGVIIAIVLGLDRLYQQNSDRSMFAKDARINVIRERVRAKRDALFGEIESARNAENGSEQRADPRWEEEPYDAVPVADAVSRESKSTDDRLDDIDNRLRSRSR